MDVFVEPDVLLGTRFDPKINKHGIIERIMKKDNRAYISIVDTTNMISVPGFTDTYERCKHNKKTMATRK